MNCQNVKMLALAVPIALLGACAVGPDYVRPQVATPVAYKELAGWKQADPRDDVARGNWWSMFNDPQLDNLQEEVKVSNQNLALAAANFRQALALVQAARASYFPTAIGTLSTTRSQASSSSGSSASTSKGVVVSHELALDAAWEADVWGRLSRTVEADTAAAQASAADLEAARLSLQALLALNYFQLRAVDAKKQLFEDALRAYDKSRQLTQNQFKAGIVSKADVAQAQTQFKATEAQVIDLGVQRAQLEHAIAVLVGKAPADFSIAPGALTTPPPVVPPGLPSELLERRPDIAAAERRMAAANAQVGIASSAYFPSFRLSAAGGYQSSSVADWFTVPSRFWAIGPAIAQVLFDGGLRRALTVQAIAAYDGAVAGYRQTVLTGFQEVEDSLAALRILELEAQVQGEAVRSARESVTLTLNQYKAGTVSYLNVVTVQTTALDIERGAVDLLNRRLAASVLLIKALGGGWDTSALPSAQQVLSAGAKQAAL